ncbi:hypothetical protein DSO57_1029949 [Entomophthora muscae]|uniref:Uncharacterized protein n=1 Tax=Entomophthora muscae TaxID=34485 RepID=A0ACC2SQE0_9FUNG|nr:hypothetical protein DSO57_1029949 [Entomophthora muscae]
MGSPVNVVSSKLVKKLKLATDLNYHQPYGTAGLSMTRAIGAYSALPMQFDKLLLAAPAVVLENESYDLLVGTQFLREYNGIIKLKDGYLSILGGNCGKFDSLKLDSLVLDTLLSAHICESISIFGLTNFKLIFTSNLGV